MKFYMIFCLIFLLEECSVSNSQGLALSYANADIGQKLIRSTVTTEPPPPTTKKVSFFGGIRNYFSKKSPETVETTSQASHVTSSPSVPSSSTTTTSTIAPITVSSTSNNIPNSIHHHNVIVPVPITTATTTTTTTLRPKPPQEDFPPLRPPRRQNSVSSTTPSTTTTINSVWNKTPPTETAHGNRENVNFIPQQPAVPQQPAMPPLPAMPQQAASSSNELEILTEELFNKESSSLFEKMTINYQGRTQSSALTDEAALPLIAVSETDLESVTSISKMRLLYNNYELDTMVNEYVSPNEKKEENEFIDAIMRTSVMRHAMSFLQQKGKVTPDPQTHRDLIKTIWFSLYSRGRGRIGSSAFEHVFLTETKNGTISGLHNWVYFHDEEEAGRANYKGWLKKVTLGKKGAVVKYRFSFNDINKPVNAMFVGTSPELEIALYTVCFQLRADNECKISLGGNKFLIRTHTFTYRGKSLIGSAFPEI